MILKTTKNKREKTYLKISEDLPENPMMNERNKKKSMNKREPHSMPNIPAFLYGAKAK